MLTEEQIRAGVDDLSLDELVGQVLNYDMNEKRIPLDKAEEFIRRTQPGSQYLGCPRPEYKQKIMEFQKKYCRTPVMITADVEVGPDNCIQDGVLLPSLMAFGAADDPDLVRRLYRATAQTIREQDVSLALAPVVDINYNFLNCLVNTRAVSDDPDEVIKINREIVKGFQQDGLVAACVKHFPGDGVDQRNQHFLTSVNSLSKEDWMNTYGRVYKTMIDAGVMAVMVAHIALPAFDEKIDDVMGYPPATLSKNLMTGLLKGELGFQGCIVSDAMSMIGACAMVEGERLAVEYLKAGGDLVLFALPTDFDYIKQAVQAGELPLERLKDAVTRVWRLKNQLGLFDGEEKIRAALQPREDLETLAQQLADKSISVVRNAEGLFPVTDLKPGAKILQVALRGFRLEEPQENRHHHLQVVEEELTKRGYEVTTLLNPMHNGFKTVKDDYDLVLIHVERIQSGGSNRVTWDQEMALWRGYLLQHPRVIFASFDDPYRLYDYPFAKTYVNVYSEAPSSQRAYVKALLGEIPAVGKNPVAFEGFFERTV